jgi:hypothetical protein
MKWTRMMVKYINTRSFPQMFFGKEHKLAQQPMKTVSSALKKSGKDRSQLIVSYIGYKPDTIEVSNSLDSIVIVLSLNREFQGSTHICRAIIKIY